MSKVRFYKVNLQNGHGAWNELIPAHSQNNAVSYFTNPDHKVLSIEHLGWLDVGISYDGYAFSFSASGIVFENNTTGYSYLAQQLHADLQKFIQQMIADGIPYP
jgi:hypothetical protein